MLDKPERWKYSISIAIASPLENIASRSLATILFTVCNTSTKGEMKELSLIYARKCKTVTWCLKVNDTFLLKKWFVLEGNTFLIGKSSRNWPSKFSEVGEVKFPLAAMVWPSLQLRSSLPVAALTSLSIAGILFSD